MSTKTVTGVVAKVFDRTHRGNTFWSLCVQENGEDTWYSAGRTKPKVAEGATVEFEAKQGKKGYWDVADVGAIKVVGSAPRAAGKAAATGGWNDPDRQKSIIVQSSIKSAIDFVSIASANGALALGSGSAAKKFDVLREAVLETAREFYGYASEPDTLITDDEPAPGPAEDDGEFEHFEE